MVALMSWKTIRLELARGAKGAKSSASHAYLLRVPLDEQGLIDPGVVARYPSQATAGRYWSSEPDQFGRIQRLDGHWVLRCSGGDGESEFRMPVAPLRLDEQITLEAPNGTPSVFRIVSIKG